MTSFHDFIDKIFVLFRVKKELSKKGESFYNHVTWLRSLSTNRLFPTVIFTADTDMVTMGWVCLSNINDKELVITQLTAIELVNEDWGQLVEDRVNTTLSKNGFRCVCFIKSIEKEPFFTDIYDSQSMAKIEKVVSKKEFEEEGGVFLVLNTDI